MRLYPRLSLLILSCFLFSFYSIAQKGKISGSVFSDSTKEKLTNINISLLIPKDSSIYSYQLTDAKGHFSFTKVHPGTYEVIVTALSHEHYSKRVEITAAHPEVTLDSIVLRVSYDTLEDVTVKAVVPMVIKTDTTDFNASAFKTRPNASVEDLLKKIPNMDVDKDGTIKAEGQKVTQILVDGKPFFGGDPKTVTQNLPADVVARVQVIDKKSEQARNSKIDDGEREKIINIVIKKDKKAGAFGNGYAAYGTNQRYEGKISANSFEGDKKMALVLSANNTGRNDYSYGSNNEGSYYNNNGLTDNKTGRFSYNNVVSKKFNYNIAGNAGATKSTNQRISNQETLYGDSSNYTYSKNNNTYTQKSVGADLSLEWNPDSTLAVRFKQSVRHATSNSDNNSIFASRLKDNKIINNGNTNYTGSSKTPGFNGELSLSKDLDTNGRRVFFNIANNLNNSNGDDYNISNNYFFPGNKPDYKRLYNQNILNTNNSSGYNGGIGYNEPLSKKSFISISYNLNYAKNDNNKQSFDYDSLTGTYTIPNDTLSNHFNNTSTTNQFGLNYSYSFKKAGFGIGMRWQQAIQRSYSYTNDSAYEQKFSGLVPSANFYINGKGKRLAVNYSFKTAQPQAYQLQPVINNFNPLYLSLGNPNLTYSSTHSLNFNGNYFNSKTGLNLYSSGNFNLVFNQISNSVILDKSTGQQISQPINVNGTYNASFYGFVGMPLYNPTRTKLKNKISLSLNFNASIRRTISMLNNEKNINNNQNFNLSPGINLSLDEWIDMRLRTDISKQVNNFSLQSNMNNDNYTYSLGTDFTIRPVKLTELLVNYYFTKRTGQAAAFNKDINMLTMELTQYFNERREFWVKLKCYDVLKQNVSIYRYSGSNYITDVESTVLTRYFLLSINCKLSKFGKGKAAAKTQSQ
ncbi:MAG: outer membrane beta-barrel protein [Filimonas sp.]|nr:outer membrane beta-barrel protein [Filimonas sp.]